MYNKVLIIDDDEISIFLTEAVLDVAQFAREYVGFACAKEALQELNFILGSGQFHKLPDVIFLDLNMPFLSGWDLLDSLKPFEEIIRNRCYIFILTSSVNEDEVEKAEDYGLVTGFIQKPLEEHAIAGIAKRN
ncbi:response regulator [Pontibacter cellulosilyticus]|uniref:Response regulator n=1 Tax=Pontibacter cellulosilyticus TaxID=1720253 RepID=A0A923N4I8_9BACT|nr:response regulator [Pontibacter cellulosilyticus]MBC5992029.1 response regulator [Pontibacter cellulosilyticus]